MFQSLIALTNQNTNNTNETPNPKLSRFLLVTVDKVYLFREHVKKTCILIADVRFYVIFTCINTYVFETRTA